MFFDLDLQEDRDVTLLQAFELTRPKKEKVKELAFQDDFEVTYTNLEYELLTDDELKAAKGSVLLFDTESYTNYFLAAFKLAGTNKVITFQTSTDEVIGCSGGVGMCDGKCDETCLIPPTINKNKLRWILQNFTVIGFYLRAYDLPIIALALAGKDAETINEASFKLVNGARPKEIELEYEVSIPTIDFIDLDAVAPLGGSLKLYAGRLHAKRMQELPIEPTARLNETDKRDIYQYCINDLNNTEILFNELKPQLELRYAMSHEYVVDLRSKSDAQISEAVIGVELERLLGKKPPRQPEVEAGKKFHYLAPSYIQYFSPQLIEMLKVVERATFVVDDGGYVTMPEDIANLSIQLGQCTYRMGIGGLHSSEKSVWYKADDDTLLIDRDVASFYPAIKLTRNLYPKHLGPAYLKVYSRIVDSRLADKKAKRMVGANSKKIVINGGFGKLGNRWSLFYSPDLLIAVTLTGQLALLLLIDMIEHLGIPVISANTDGVIIKCPKSRYDELEQRIKLWEQITSFETEETRYTAVYSRDVNNYIAIKDDGSVKTKGAYSDKGSAGNSSLSRNPENFICNDAVIKFLTEFTPIADTINTCCDVRKFVTVRNVKGGAVKSGKYLARCVRFYYSTEMQGEINYKLSGNKVPNSEGARPLMELPTEVPYDLDYAKYIAIANDILIDIGVSPAPEKKKKARVIEETSLLFDF